MAKLSVEELARRKAARASAAAIRKHARESDPEWIAQRRAKSRLYCAAHKRRKQGIVLPPEEALAEAVRHETTLLDSRRAKAESLAADLERFERENYWADREAELVQEATERRLRSLGEEVERRLASEMRRVAARFERLNVEIDRIEALESSLAEKSSRPPKDAPRDVSPKADPSPYEEGPLGDLDDEL